MRTCMAAALRTLEPSPFISRAARVEQFTLIGSAQAHRFLMCRS